MYCRLAAIQAEVGAWSVTNFGDQNGLGQVAPLLGLMEEHGEFAEAKTHHDRLDALGDVLVYLCDFTHRDVRADNNIATRPPEAVVWQRGVVVTVPALVFSQAHQDLLTKKPTMTREAATTRLTVGIGKLAHAVLKREQGIRNMDKPAQYTHARDNAVVFILEAVGALSYVDNVNPLRLLETTWQGVVAKRNWKTDPTAGGGHRHPDGAGPFVG